MLQIVGLAGFHLLDGLVDQLHGLIVSDPDRWLLEADYIDSDQNNLLH